MPQITRWIAFLIPIFTALLTALVGVATTSDRSTDVIAFASEKWRGYNMFDLLVMDTHTLETRTLTEGIGGAAYVDWSADGRYLLFTDEPDVIRIDVVTGDRATLTALRDGLHHSSAWAPFGDRVAYLTSGGYFPEVIVSDKDGAQHRRLEDWYIYGAAPPVWSPDGTWLAVVIRGEDSADIALVDPVTLAAINLTNDAQRNDDVTWSPDGQSLTFTSGDAATGFALQRYDIATGERVTIQQNGSFIGRPAWSPDGERMAFVMREGRGNFHLYLYEGQAVSRVMDTPIAPSWLAWSPDGTRIALVRVEGRRAMPYVVDVERRLMARLSDQRALYLTPPQWRPID